MIPNVNPPRYNKFPGVQWFAGLDPAVKRDNFGVVIHGLMPKTKAQEENGQPWNPFIREVFEVDHENFTEIINWLNGVLFQYYPPRYCIIDATRDTPTSQEMERKYGEDRVKAMAMTNQINYELKQTGYTFLEQGYTWPNTEMMTDLVKARAIADLKVQNVRERVEYTRDNRLKFTHPPGQHNDLNRAWEMSLKAVKDYQLGHVGNVVIDPEIYEDYPTEEIGEYDDDTLTGSFSLPNNPIFDDDD